MENKTLTFATRTMPQISESQKDFSQFEDLYEYTIDNKGNKKLIQKGKTNIYEKIQMYKDDCDIYKIIQRAQLGDTSLLEQRAGKYADTTEIPKTLHEHHKFLTKAMDDYKNLPDEIKKEFNNDLYEFAQADQKQLEKVIRKVKKLKEIEEEKSEPKTEIKENEKHE